MSVPKSPSIASISAAARAPIPLTGSISSIPILRRNLPGTSNSGIYAAWSWGLSRLIDGMEIASRQSVNPLPVDTRRLGVTGCSFAGKMASLPGHSMSHRPRPSPRRTAAAARRRGASRMTSSHSIGGRCGRHGLRLVRRPDAAVRRRQRLQAASRSRRAEAMVAPRALLETGNTVFTGCRTGPIMCRREPRSASRPARIGDRFGFYIDGGMHTVRPCRARVAGDSRLCRQVHARSA